MKFSEHFGVAKTDDDDWHDIVLSADTRLFVDPFRIYVDTNRRWAAAHAQLTGFFEMVLKLIARASGDRTSARWRAAERLAMFPEPAEFCLGFGTTPLGAGTGTGLREGVLEGAQVAVDLGRESISHIEELRLFEPGIGADRISDIACNVLKQHFIGYTQEVARRHGIRMQELPVAHARWDSALERWFDDRVALPLNPFTGKGVLLTPQRFLRKLPTVDPEEFWDWAWVNENETLRDEFNYDLGKNVDAPEIARLARRHADLAERYVAGLENDPKPAYDVETDPEGEVQWYYAGQRLADRVAFVVAPVYPEAFCDWVGSLLDGFVHNIEQQDGWILLWADDRPRKERYAQALLRTAVWQMCRANDVDFTGEPNAGRGPTDFKFSQGWSRRALVEVKRTSNSQYWHGLTQQTKQYMISEQIRCGFFLSIGFYPGDLEEDRKRLVRKAAAKVSADQGYEIKPVFVDATPKRSASRSNKPMS